MLFTGHAVALDLNRTELFCCACKDYVYDAEFDRAATARHTCFGPFALGPQLMVAR